MSKYNINNHFFIEAVNGLVFDLILIPIASKSYLNIIQTLSPVFKVYLIKESISNNLPFSIDTDIG